MINSQHYKLEKGGRLFSEGDASDYIYYVRQGSLEIFTETEQKTIVLGQVPAGEFVGELGVLQNTRRNASVRALENTQLERLTLNTFLRKISQDSDRSQKLLHSLSYRTHNVALLIEQVAKKIAEHKSTLSWNPFKTLLTITTNLFKWFKKQIYKRELARHNTQASIRLDNGVHTIRKGKTLFVEGQESHFACLILKGKFKARKSLHDSHQHIAMMQAGEFIGEMGLLQNSPRSLTVVALTNAQVRAFDESAFLDYVSQDQEAFITLIKNLSERASVLNQHLKELTEQHAAILNPSALMQTKQLLQNIGHLSQVTRQMLEQDLHTLQTAFVLEAAAVQSMLEVYYQFINGKASQKQMDQANADFRNFLKTLGLGALIIIPGSFITIPLIVKLGKSVGIDILPKIRS